MLMATSFTSACLAASMNAADFEANSIGATDAAQENYFLGNVGIGLDNPEQQLHVDGLARIDGKLGIKKNPIYDMDVKGDNARLANAGSAYSQWLLDRFSDETKWVGYLAFRKSHTNVLDVKETTVDGEAIGIIAFRGVNAAVSPAFYPAAQIAAIQDGTAGSRVPGRIEFRTTEFNGANKPRLTIKSNGRVGIATQSPSETLHVNGSARFDAGIMYIPALGDISMGSFTNSP
jgi:hypothetical protein